MSLAKSSLLFSFGTFFSRIAGLVREVVLATIFGATAVLDSFLIANRIPNMLRELAAEGALGSAFTKVFSELWEKDQNRARSLLGNLVVLLSLVLSLICLIGIIFAPIIVESLFLFKASASQSERFADTIGLTRILFPFIAFMSLAAIFAGALHQKGRFFLSALAPIALNLGYIFGALILAFLFKSYGPAWIDQRVAPREVVGLAFGVLLGGFCQMIILFYGMKQSFFKEYKIIPTHLSLRQNPDIKKVLGLMWPMIIAASAGQVNVFVNTNFATSLAEGSVSYLSFAFRLLQLPIGIFAVAIGVTSLPKFTREATQEASYEKLNRTIENSLELTLWFLLPCVCFILINRQEVIGLLFERGRFTPEATYYTSEVLFYYTLGLVSYGFVKVLTSLAFALERIKFAMRVGLFSILTNFILNYFLVQTYRVNGLAISMSLVMTINACLLFWGILQEEKIKLNYERLKRCLILVLGISFGVLAVQSFIRLPLYGALLPMVGKFSASFFLLVVQGLLVCFSFILGYSWYSKIHLKKLLRKVSKRE